MATILNQVPEKEVNPLLELESFGQSIWLDYIRRSLITSGQLQRLITRDGLRGVTSNPSIFEKAITGSTDYAELIRQLEAKNLSPDDIYEIIAIRDIQDAADILLTVYEATDKRDGYVSLEVSPYMALDAPATLKEARRLWKLVNRPNVMIKVPATPEGMPAIQQLLSEGINVNVTLLFSQELYGQAAEAFLNGLAVFVAQGGHPGQVASVASFFISRIDTAVDGLLTTKLQSTKNAAERELLNKLMGKAAIANAKQAYQLYKELFSGTRWKQLRDKGARPQRLLWASTSTKNPRYRDVMYVEELIGPDTVNTAPMATLDAFRDHGRAPRTLDSNILEASEVLRGLEKVGVSMREVTVKLLEDGLALFSKSFDQLLGSVTSKAKRPSEVRAKIDCLQCTLPQPLRAAVEASLRDWQTNDKTARLWRHDSALWTGKDEGNWMGWLSITEDQVAHCQVLGDFSEEIARSGFRDALLLGMGGSSLCPEVLKTTFGKRKGYPELHVLDSTDPAQIKAIEDCVNLKKTLFIVSSKSGTTLEPNIFEEYFFERVQRVLGTAEAGDHFIAITDPGSELEKTAKAKGFRRVFHGIPSIGGRYSALSNFGLVPAAVMGLDVVQLLDRTEEMVAACAPSVRVEENPGLVLGAILGALGRAGHDKVTFIASPAIAEMGAWLEQLLAESTGKQGRGLIPIAGEDVGAPEVYGSDRTFIYLRLRHGAAANQDSEVDALQKAGQPVIRLDITDLYDVGQEFFRWEFATAVAGSILEINPFDQPDVEASKVATRQLTAEYEKAGAFPPEKPIFEADGIQVFADQAYAAQLLRAIGNSRPPLVAMLRAHLNQIVPGDYVALLAYLHVNLANEAPLQRLRHVVRDRKQVATCLGFGPRFLHSTGQAYKGGPNSGVFLEITADDALDVPIPGHEYTFGVVKAAQARGDFQVLAGRKRRLLRLHLPADVGSALNILEVAVEEALT